MPAAPHEPSTAVIPGDSRKLIAVVQADMVGYSRLIGLDDAGTFARLQELRSKLFLQAAERHGGTLISNAGDCLQGTFDSVIAAVRFAIEVQRGVPDFDGDYPADRRLRFRVGVNIGDVILDGTNMHGDGVNIAARLQTVCPPGGICVSRVVRDQVGNRLGLGFKELGAVDFKNIARPIEAFLLELEPEAGSPLLLTAPVRHWRRAWAGAAVIGVAATVGIFGIRSNAPPPSETATQTDGSSVPAVSIAVLPFDNLSGDPEQTYLADGICEDLTTDLSHLDNAFVISRESAFSYRGKSVDIREVGRQLGVRYVLEGSVRKLGDAVRINAQLVSARDGAHVWADRFDQPLRDLQAGQDSTVRRIGAALNVKFDDAKLQPKLVDANPTAYDLVLRAKAILHEPQSASRDPIAAGYFEQALRLDASSVPAEAGVATMLVKAYSSPPKRAAGLIARAELVAPNSPDVLAAKFRLLRRELRFEDAVATFRKLLDIDSSAAGIAAEFEFCPACWGRPEDAVDLLARTAQLNPMSPDRGVIYVTLGRMLILLGHDAEAIDWLQRAHRLTSERLPSAPREASDLTDVTSLLLATAYALVGQLDDAHGMLASAMSSNRTMDTTVRRFLNTIPKYYDAQRRQQELRIADGLRLAGLRDHLDERTDFHILSTSDLRDNVDAPTPTTVPGGTTITTEELVRLLETRPLVLTTAEANPTIPGAIRFGLPNSGSLTDEWQAALERLMDEVTRGDTQRPIVTFAYSINRWHARNLAVRLIALGYRNVYWYRGGWEAWDAHDLPKAPLDLQFSAAR